MTPNPSTLTNRASGEAPVPARDDAQLVGGNVQFDLPDVSAMNAIMAVAITAQKLRVTRPQPSPPLPGSQILR
jgi:hypothetical protein